MNDDKLERMYVRAMAIQEGRALGHWLPVMRALAQRRYPHAMVELGAWLMSNCRGQERKAFLLARQAYRRGCATGAQNLAMDCFNRTDLAGYRYWLSKAARMGDLDCARELRRFEIRLPHGRAFELRRGRPRRKCESVSVRRPY